MKMWRCAIVGSALLAVAALGVVSCAQKPAEDTEAEQKVMQALQSQDEANIRAIDAAWAKAIASKDADQTTSVYAENGTLLAPGAPIASGKDAIRKTWAGLMGSPGFALQFAPTRIEISKSGDSAYEIGDYQLTVNGKNGKPQTVKAKYVVVWGKQADGSWKALVDAPTTTQ
ncbi:MAG TPA: SgcJ/EcaC family oxidoreductase [Candidatus Dormibacteraeota bacterium]|nr:SgcJ/EcaC family oxidoreductase [Candidatus Dormibacteraeota bacterium]